LVTKEKEKVLHRMGGLLRDGSQLAKLGN